jgi:hypothetical protein
MNRDRYVELLADLLSADPDRVSAANKILYDELVTDGCHPSLALVDAEQKLQG